MRPPCEGKPEFTNPTKATPKTITEALEMCHHCPLRTDCAKQAIVAGNTLDGERKTHAVDVIQAGIWLDGTIDATLQLYELVGQPPPIKRRRMPTPTTCKECGRHMIARDKSIRLDATILTHAARGYCRVCYSRLKREGKLVTLHPKHQAALGWREHHQRKTS